MSGSFPICIPRRHRLYLIGVNYLTINFKRNGRFSKAARLFTLFTTQVIDVSVCIISNCERCLRRVLFLIPLSRQKELENDNVLILN